MIRAVIFDMFETLVTLFTGRTYFSENIAEDLGVPLTEFRAAWHATEDERTIGKYTMEEGFSETLRKLNLYNEDWVELVCRKRREALGDTFSAVPEASVQLLKDLKAHGIRTALISNCFSDERAMILQSELYPLFDTVRLSFEQGVKKPDPSMYQSIMEEFGVTPAECLYIGDGGSHELQAARKLGMSAAQAMWFRPGMFEPHVSCPVFSDFPHLEKQADVVTEALRIDYEVTDHITPEEYMQMRREVGWSEFPLEQAAEGLKNTTFLCCLRREGEPIALARVLWDHGYVVYIADIIVRPPYQKGGLGRDLMNRVIGFIEGTILKPGYRVMISLQSAKGKEEFYERFGFAPRPTPEHGCGMHRWMEAKSK
ncbi:MAG: HAD-IA family hydrolase [Lachnospiraceae bacterium]|nr:HAD-IA family hydrolase [Lachnospiraceae bacterium]